VKKEIADVVATYNTERSKFAALDTELYEAIKAKNYIKNPKAFEKNLEDWADQRDQVMETFKTLMAKQMAEENEVE
jgi:hypothetical protein